jgi:hypothetical protein
MLRGINRSVLAGQRIGRPCSKKALIQAESAPC